jgi:hypothetical protein
MPSGDPFYNDLSDMTLRLIGEAGQASLSMAATSAGARASVDQHAAQIRDALAQRGRAVTPAALLSYAQGFAEAAIARGWRPPRRQGNLRAEAVDWASPGALDHARHGTPACTDGAGLASLPDGGLTDPPGARPHRLDWESLRLAAVCQMLIEAEFSG